MILTGNNVATKLSIANYNLKPQVFPPNFICKFLWSSLVEIDASNNNFFEISKCIGKFESMVRLDIRNNTIHASGIHKNITKLNNLKYFLITGNAVEASLSWQKQHVTPAFDGNGVLDFTIKFFKDTLTSLDISHNQYVRFDDIIDYLDNLTKLEILNASHNLLEGELSFQKTAKMQQYSYDKATIQTTVNRTLEKWKSLEIIDISNNRIENIHSIGVILTQKMEDAGKRIYFMNNNIKSLSFAQEIKHFHPYLPKSIYNQTPDLFILTWNSHDIHRIYRFDWTYFCVFKQLSFLFFSAVPKKTVTEIPICLSRISTVHIDCQHYAENLLSNWNPAFFQKPYSQIRKLTFRLCKSTNYSLDLPMVPMNSNLEYLHIVQSELSFKFPSIENFTDNSTLCGIKEISFLHNKLHGPLRSWGANCSIEKLNVAMNHLHGDVAQLSALLKNLKKLYLFHNKRINGSLPNVAIPKLNCLDIRGTGIAGPIPSQYFKLTMLLLPITYENYSTFPLQLTCEKKKTELYYEESWISGSLGPYMQCIKSGEEKRWKIDCLDNKLWKS